jgi:hypothetical protein
LSALENANAISKNLHDHIEQFRATNFPKGFFEVCTDVDLDIVNYFDYVSGLISLYEHDHLDIAPETVQLGEDLAKRISECETRLQALKNYLDMMREIARLLADRLRA